MGPFQRTITLAVVLLTGARAYQPCTSAWRVVLAVMWLAFIPAQGAVAKNRSCCGPCATYAPDPSPALSRVEDMPRLAEVSQLLFLGTVIRAEVDPCCEGWADVTFQVNKQWKGEPEPRMTIRTGESCASPYPFRIGVEYLVSARYPGDHEVHRTLYMKFTPVEAPASGSLAWALDQWHRAQNDHDWVAQALTRMLSIKPGMTRAQLLETFTTEGGFSNRLARTYAYRDYPYFKVDVVFEAVGEPANDALAESPDDVIKTISTPYLQWSNSD